MADSQRKTANLFDIRTIINGVIDQDGNIVATGSSYRTSDYIPVSGSNYIVSLIMNVDTARRIFVALYDGNKTFISRLESSEMTNTGLKTYTFSANTANFIRICIVNTDTNIMLNTGSTALPYEPYWQHSLRKLGTATDTITTLPVDLYADGNSATVGLQGNMTQTGTPTPENPITPQETGERTGNLFSCDIEQGGLASADGQPTVSDTRIRTDNYISLTQGSYTVSIKETNKKVVFYVYNTSKQYIQGESVTSWQSLPFQFTLSADRLVKFAFANDNNTNISPSDISEVTLNTGSTALPYEPYGYKIPISSASTTTPVYLGEVQSTRKIKKLVLTGEETAYAYEYSGNNGYSIRDVLDTSYSRAEGYCSHYVVSTATPSAGTTQVLWIGASNAHLYFVGIADIIGTTSANEFKQWLAQQYANGTPVTVWYVLAEPTTGIVNEPIRKIGDYADSITGITIPTITGKDTFDVETTLKPSEVSLAYTGWHDAEVKEWDGSQWQ